jgi:hypothetical protein
MKIAHHHYIEVWANGYCWVYFHGRICFGRSLLGAAAAAMVEAISLDVV